MMITPTTQRRLLLVTVLTLLSPLCRAQDNAIFKDGKPREVKETSYVIRNGERLENQQKKGLFGWRNTEKKTISTSSGNAEVPIFDTPEGPAPAPVNNAEAVEPVAPAPPQTKRKGLLGLPSLPTLPRFRRKDPPVDTSDAEILVNNGGTLTPIDADNTEDYRVEVSNTGSDRNTPVQPPTMKNGTVVYESWDDVQYKQTSAAELIVKSMREQEQAHNRKVAQAKKEYEEQVRKAQEAAKKAQEEAKIRAIMSGGLTPPPAPPGLQGPQ